ncbi:hypothetical protein V6Z12_A05G136800 [Gossypium hirsutum]
MQSQQSSFFFSQHFFIKKWAFLNLLCLVLLTSVAPSPDEYALDAAPTEYPIPL